LYVNCNFSCVFKKKFSVIGNGFFAKGLKIVKISFFFGF
jgi:hypothetical protein